MDVVTCLLSLDRNCGLLTLSQNIELLFELVYIDSAKFRLLVVVDFLLEILWHVFVLVCGAEDFGHCDLVLLDLPDGFLTVPEALILQIFALVSKDPRLLECF